MSNDTPQPGAQPYGPATLRIRKFLQRLAALHSVEEERIVRDFDAHSLSREFRAAELSVGVAVERSGRSAAQTALAGPLLQLMKKRSPASADVVFDTADDDLRAIAAPALAALLALMMQDVLAPKDFAQLYEPFASAIPFNALEQ